MNRENFTQDLCAFPYDVEDVLGTIIDTEWQCPGVWYVANEGNGQYAGEFYIVEDNAACISDAAKLHGAYLENHPDLLLYRRDDPEGGRGIINYEIARYRKKHGLPLPEGETLLMAAVFAMETNPEYFGKFPAPIQTPRGTMTRYYAIANGLFLLETDECERMIAVCYPLWDAALTEYTKALAEQTAYDRQQGIHSTLGYLFFSEEHGCLALFELLSDVPEILTCGRIDAPALYNSIWKSHPDYAAQFNRNEQAGLHDALGLLLRVTFGEDVDLTGSVDRMISYHLDAGTDYLKF